MFCHGIDSSQFRFEIAAKEFPSAGSIKILTLTCHVKRYAIFFLFYPMISPFYRNLTPIAIALICFVACSKEKSDPASILMSKTWYPYQVEIMTTDSTYTVVTDKLSGEQKETNQVLKTDTVYLASACQQKSLYHFKSNGVQTITDSCSSNATDYTGTWKINQANEMLLSQFVTGRIPLAGFVTGINPSEFTISSVDYNISIHGDSTDANGNQVNLAEYNFITTVLTFKSR